MWAFGLEECGEYSKAEKEARYALELQRQDCWATHAIAHCCEMNSKYEDGIKFMESTVADWEPCYILACHNFWHNALFYVEKGEYEKALQIYDDEIEKRCHSNAMLDIVDAASMLCRLEMEKVNVGDRWKKLEPFAESHVGDHVLAFNDAHMSIIVSSLEDDRLLKKHRKSMGEFVRYIVLNYNYDHNIYSHCFSIYMKVLHFACTFLIQNSHIFFQKWFWR